MGVGVTSVLLLRWSVLLARSFGWAGDLRGESGVFWIMGGALGMRQSLHLNLDFYGVLLACLAYSVLCVATVYTYKNAESEMQSMHTLLCAVCATVRNSSISPYLHP